uniref:LRAT domain-containing protein n=1 Tax=Sus scrofa TaxID=9823 RepID=A0A8D0TFT4_PIG
MGLSPATRGECRRRSLRFPRPRLKPASRTASLRPDDNQPTPGPAPGPQSGRRRSGAPSHWAPTSRPGTLRGRSAGPSRPSGPQQEESVGSQAWVQLLPKQPQQGPSEQGSSNIQQGEKPVVSLESTPNQKRAEWPSTPKPGSAGRLIKTAAEVGIISSRIIPYHIISFQELPTLACLWPLGEEFEAGSITSIFSNRAVVKYSRLEDVLHGCSWKVNNKLDGMYLPLPVDQIIQRTKQMINKIVQYSLIEGNCEHFVNDLRYGVRRSQQVEHVLMEGAKAAGAVISAVVDSMRPRPALA